jgi:DNA-binding transcriptional ArsR family regulator
MRQWTFVTNHAVVLSLVAHHSSITARDLSLEIGITERAVRRIIAELEVEGYIVKKKEGRRVRYRIKPDVPLRHSSHRDKAIGELLEVLSWTGKKTERMGVRKT